MVEKVETGNTHDRKWIKCLRVAKGDVARETGILETLLEKFSFAKRRWQNRIGIRGAELLGFFGNFSRNNSPPFKSKIKEI